MCLLRQIFHEAIDGVAVVLAEQFCIRPFLGGTCGRESESSEQTCIAQAVRPAVSRGIVCPEMRAVGCLCPGYRLSSPLWDVAAQPCRGRVTRTSLQAFKPLRARSPTCAVPCWNAANCICAKRLMPFLPTLIDALERHEHLHITEECRRQLLSMSAATADRLLSSQRKVGQRGPSTTRAGTLLKQQIPIRTFQQWNETRPGYLEADLVAHCPLWHRHQWRLSVYGFRSPM